MNTRHYLTHPWLTVRMQIALGVIFIVAALPKFVDPPSFAHMIYNYRILPGALINLSALVMPWVELICGVALVLGIWKRSSSAIVAAMLVVFIIAIGINLGRGNPIDCGCFEVNARPKSVEELFFDMKVVVARDIGMLVMIALMWAGWRRQETEASAEVA